MSNLSLSARIPLLTFLGLVTFGSILGNGLVLLAWIFHKPVRKPQNSYLVSLAIADLLVGLFLAPTMMGELGADGWPWGRSWCQVYMLFAWLLATASVLHLLAIAMDRYHVVFDTLTYMNRRTYGFFLRRICLIWIFALWLIIPPMRDWDAIGDRSEEFGLCVANMSADLSVHLAFGSYVLPIILLFSTYVAIYRQLRQRSELLHRSTIKTISSNVSNNHDFAISSNNRSRTKVDNGFSELRRNRRAVKMLGIIFGAFALSWFPFTLGYSIIGFVAVENRPAPVILPIIVAIGYSNSAMNPCIYAYVNPDFRKGFVKVLLFWKTCNK